MEILVQISMVPLQHDIVLQWNHIASKQAKLCKRKESKGKHYKLWKKSIRKKLITEKDYRLVVSSQSAPHPCDRSTGSPSPAVALLAQSV